MEALRTAQTRCPYCGEPIELLIDCSVARQDYIEDCPVCCRPLEVGVDVDGNGGLRLTAGRDDEA